jgi:hypothetical protein
MSRASFGTKRPKPKLPKLVLPRLIQSSTTQLITNIDRQQDLPVRRGRSGISVYVGESIILHYNPANPWQNTLGEYVPFSAARFIAGFTIMDATILWLFHLIFVRSKRSV